MNKQRLDRAYQAAKTAQDRRNDPTKADDHRGEIIARLARLRKAHPEAELTQAARQALAAYLAEHYGLAWGPRVDATFVTASGQRGNVARLGQ